MDWPLTSPWAAPMVITVHARPRVSSRSAAVRVPRRQRCGRTRRAASPTRSSSTFRRWPPRSIGSAARFLPTNAAAALSAAIQLSPREARHGATVPLEVPVRCTCRACGGRGETWTEPCGRCDGSGGDCCGTSCRSRSRPASSTARASTSPSPPATIRRRASSCTFSSPSETRGTPRHGCSASWRGCGERWRCWSACRCCCWPRARWPSRRSRG